MDELKQTGGARIGMINAIWPFATLRVNKDKLALDASVLNLVFKPADVVSIERYKPLIPVLGYGIRIRHRVSSYKSKVIFWTYKNPDALISKIEQTGFLNNADPVPPALENEITDFQSKGGFPVRTSAAVAVVIVWHLFIFIDFRKSLENGLAMPHSGIGAQLALGFVFLTCISLLVARPVRRLFLKEGRTLGDVRKFLYFLMFTCIYMFLFVTFLA